ncbi:hypothetical protein D9756_008289 [Leucocoprinus leucothites]|uniref:RNA helicase n=1 Tax=Leucocoprinus leucothites TaxID=201217 RepID=A0A8H5FWD5_9AGAR|nr:hypothetical protein D9756_008289 [Leucoagaricus leucothites]
MPPNCRNIVATGSCTDPGCRFNHNILTCDPCNYVAASVDEYNAHLQGKKHKRVLAGSAHQIWYCRICECPIGSGSWSSHKRGKPHRKNAKSKGLDVHLEPDPVVPLNTHTFCTICQTSIATDYWQPHIRGRSHLAKERYTAFKSVLDEAEKDKNGVAIEGEVDFGILEPTVAATGKTTALKISSTVPLAKIVLVSVKLSVDLGPQKKKKIISPFTYKVEGGNRKVTSQPIIVNITFTDQHIGRYQDRLEFEFEDQQLKKTFIVSRTVRAIIGDRTAHEQLKARAPYVPRIRTRREPETKVVEGVAPPSLNAIPYVTKLPRAAIPPQLLATLTLSSRPTRETLESIKRAFLPRLLDAETHGRHFKTLIWIEEHQMEEDLERYDMVDSTLNKHDRYYYLHVPGLAEKRPSVLIGKYLSRSKRTLKATGTQAMSTLFAEMKLVLSSMNLSERALDTAFTEARILFPDSSHLPMVPTLRLLPSTINKLILTNVPQLQAVSSIVAAAPGSLPFVVFGPPGTGKTITVVEAILQLVKKNPDIRILACAPSNSAADLIALRLSGNLRVDELFRMYAPSRDERQVPDILKEHSYYRNNGESRPCFSVPPMAAMKRYRVIVSTLISASIAFGIGMPRGHFSHIFIDEAGQATEPEAFVSIKTLADPRTNVVLSGDPKQLGPIIRSGIAMHLGLELSYIERIMERPPYEQSGGHGKSIVKLVKNFRSHEAILRFPNERFYGNDLQPCGERKVINGYLNSSYLPNKKFPIVFHAVSGKDDREASSPSFFNIDEVLQVKSYVEQLKSDRVFRTNDQDIGIITPYHAQCLKIRSTLRGVADEVKVGSVEEFQGQERAVIIISTVRSSKNFVEYDIKHTLGFVASPRRFNVSVTRAKALLIVVGDPDVLGLDPLWRSFLNYVYNNKGWKGPDIPWDPSEPVDEAGGYDAAARNTAALDMNDFTRRMESMTMEGMEEDPDVGVDKPWRELE